MNTKQDKRNRARREALEALDELLQAVLHPITTITKK